MDRVCDRFEAAWKAGKAPRLGTFLDGTIEPERSLLLRHLLALELDYRSRAGDGPHPAAYHEQFPDDAELIDAVFADAHAEAGAETPRNVGETAHESLMSADELHACSIATQSFTEGRRLGRFKLVELLGRGAFGSVYRAYDPVLDRDIALKIPRAGTLLDPDDVNRFMREGRAAAQLRHPNIVAVHDAGEADGTRYIASDLIEGQTLRQVLQSERRFSHSEAAAFVSKLASALEYAHSVGVIHRDIKPENVMLDADGEPHLMDFGLARREQGEALRTQEGARMGTPAYMSPEQVDGKSHLADAQSDLWSLGVILYEILAGHRPFEGGVQQVMRGILEQEPARPGKLDKSIPSDLEVICLRCLAKPLDVRYPSCRYLADDLNRWLRGEPIDASPFPARAQAPRWGWKRRLAVSLGMTAGLALAAAIVTAGLLPKRYWHDAPNEGGAAGGTSWTASPSSRSPERPHAMRTDSRAPLFEGRDEFRVNTLTAGVQGFHPASPEAVAMDAEGNAVIVWFGDGPSGNARSIYAQRFDPQDNRLGSQWQVNADAIRDQYDPAVAMAPDGRFVVVWASEGLDGDGLGICARRYDADGAAQGAEFQVNTTTTRDQTNPSVAMDPQGNFVIAWSWHGFPTGADAKDVYARRYDAAGVPQGPEFRGNSTTVDEQFGPAVAVSALGDFLIAWSSRNQDGYKFGVYGRWYDADGTARAPEFRINTTTENHESNPSAAMDADGNFVVSWLSDAQDTSGWGVFAQRYGAGGTSQGPEFRVTTSTDGNQGYPASAMDSAGEYIIAWASANQDGDGTGVFFRRYDPAGRALGSEVQANITTAGLQGNPSVAMAPNGHVLIVWSGNGPGDDSGVFARRFVPISAVYP